MKKEFVAGGKVKKPKYKMGPYSNAEKQYIHDNLSHKNYMQIAEHLNRDPYRIKKYLEDQGFKTSFSGSPTRIDTDVEKKEFWPILQTQFSPPELDLFKYHWKKIHTQFNDDVLPTEELQIIALIKIEIIMNRNLREQKNAQDSIRNIQNQLEDESDKEVVNELERKLSIHSTGNTALIKEYRELQDKANKLFSDLKATRGDRIKKYEASKESFLMWMEKVVGDAEFRQTEGKYLEKFRLAMKVEEERLMQYHKFDDGKVDQCIYNENSVDKYDDELS